MRENPWRIIGLLAAMVAMPAANAQFQTGNPYNGNGNTGFGGTLGTGNFVLAQNGANISLTFNKGAGAFNDPVVIFLNTVAGGVSSTSSLTDTSDGFRTAVSGNAGSPLSFSSGFGADYAIVFNGTNTALFNLSPNNNFSFISNPSLGVAGNVYTLGFSQSQIGLNPAQANNLDFVANVVSTSGFRSNEFLGANPTLAGNPGFTTPVALGANQFNRFALVAIPEPASLALLGLALLPGAALLRRRK